MTPKGRPDPTISIARRVRANGICPRANAATSSLPKYSQDTDLHAEQSCTGDVETTERVAAHDFARPSTEAMKGHHMNWDQIEGKWKEMTGEVKAKWGDLTDDDVAEVNGNREALEGKIQAKYGKSKEEAKKEVDEFMNNH
ncbi:CsbD family protein [Sulfitobacter sp. JB4-11]|uniref:CsbD family protein n=1 Tax=Sulfitobacter rhodophyticola TaxID=3238304 RepID=UPI003513A054